MILRYLKALLAAFTAPPPRLPRARADQIASAYESAARDIGEREDPLGSNSGAYVEGLRKEVRLPRLAGGEWCAVFCSAHMRRVGIDIRSRGAKKLVTAMAKEGRTVTYGDLRPGLCGLSLHKRSGGWHVRLWRCDEGLDGGLVVSWVGGNERNQVKDGRLSALNYTLTAKLMATI